MVLPPSPDPTLSPVPPAPIPTPRQVLPESVRGVNMDRLPTDRKIVALTFDAGAGAQGIPSILNTLSLERVPGTFFLTGKWVEAYPDLARRIAAVQINSIANHTYDHPYLTKKTDAQVDYEIEHARTLIQEATGRDTRPLFRFPYGDRNARLLARVNALDYASILWTVDTLGWEGKSRGVTVQTVHDRVMAHLQPGEIILMHVGASEDGSTLDADALRGVIASIRAQGYDFVAIWDFIYGQA